MTSIQRYQREVDDHIDQTWSSRVAGDCPYLKRSKYETENNPNLRDHAHRDGMSLKQKREEQLRYADSHSKLHGVRFLQEYLLWPILLTPSRNQDWLCDMAEPLYERLIAGSFSQSISENFAKTIFIAIDFEGYPYPSELGISKLEREELQSIESNGVEGLKGFHTLHYQCRDIKRKRAHRAFLFGETKNLYLEELPSVLDEILRTNSGANDQSSAPHIILVGHGMKAELDILESMQIDLEKAGSVVGILDTKQLAFEIIGIETLQRGSSLEDIYRLIINDRAGSFHNAGNDAECALRVLIMLALKVLR
ncbi:hypothetical protein IFR05_007869 [Cadophora sp. M221]|nr:hypothetical protein IFR05_007869 [Cadophora sp. M221]